MGTLLPLMLAACASSSGPSPQAADAQRASGSFQPSAGTAGLYIFKEGMLGGIVDSHRIILDGLDLGMVAPNSYLYTPLTPGTHSIVSGSSQVSLTVESGQNYFVRQTPIFDSSGQIVASTVSVVSTEVGKHEVQKMQLANFGH
ncbi:MAG: DUF2846 domain-containing protein [Methylacidiphilales bacterium]|nr:DUF2846 domain-containing protein [Candidatus Methylacidiphilales bacterium]